MEMNRDQHHSSATRINSRFIVRGIGDASVSSVIVVVYWNRHPPQDFYETSNAECR